MSIGPWQIIIIVLLLVILFGRGKISELMGDVAKGIKSFKKGIAEETDEAKDAVADTAKTIELEAEEMTEKAKDKAKS
ncbi:MAG: twin-arginine translocase TatA/TatE family subunit [Pseudomonadota bacterium]